MSLDPAAIGTLAAALAEARRAGTLARAADLRRLTGPDDAEAVQAEALLRFSGGAAGYALTATSQAHARQLGCAEPVVAPLSRRAILDDGAAVRLPEGVLGAGVGFAFRLGRPFPGAGEAITAARAAGACVSCHLDLHLLGRRVPGTVPLNDWTAAADFGLDVVRALGPRLTVRPGLDLELRAIPVTLRVDGHVLARGSGEAVMGSPFEAVAWLARRLAGRGAGLEAGDLVATGSCLGFVQVLPGQTVGAMAAPLDAVGLQLT